MNLVIPKVGARRELLFKPTSGLYLVKLHNREAKAGSLTKARA
jgi:hypothetical protein